MLASRSASFAQILLKNQCRNRSLSFLFRSPNKVTCPQNVLAKRMLLPQIRNHSGGDPREAFPFPKWIGSPIRSTINVILYMFVLGFWAPWILFYIMMQRQ